MNTFEVPPHHAALDIGSLALIVLTALGYMPGIAAGLAVIWYLILIFDRIRHGHKREH